MYFHSKTKLEKMVAFICSAKYLEKRIPAFLVKCDSVIKSVQNLNSVLHKFPKQYFRTFQQMLADVSCVS